MYIRSVWLPGWTQNQGLTLNFNPNICRPNLAFCRARLQWARYSRQNSCSVPCAFQPAWCFLLRALTFFRWERLIESYMGGVEHWFVQPEGQKVVTMTLLPLRAVNQKWIHSEWASTVSLMHGWKFSGVVRRFRKFDLGRDHFSKSSKSSHMLIAGFTSYTKYSFYNSRYDAAITGWPFVW